MKEPAGSCYGFVALGLYLTDVCVCLLYTVYVCVCVSNDINNNATLVVHFHVVLVFWDHFI